jgi:hypothetical protein
MLHGWQGLSQASAPSMNEQFCPHACPTIAQPLHYLRPTIDPVHVGRFQRDALAGILSRDGGPIALPAENVRCSTRLLSGWQPSHSYSLARPPAAQAACL